MHLRNSRLHTLRKKYMWTTTHNRGSYIYKNLDSSPINENMWLAEFAYNRCNWDATYAENYLR